MSSSSSSSSSADHESNDEKEKGEELGAGAAGRKEGGSAQVGEPKGNLLAKFNSTFPSHTPQASFRELPPVNEWYMQESESGYYMYKGRLVFAVPSYHTKVDPPADSPIPHLSSLKTGQSRCLPYKFREDAIFVTPAKTASDWLIEAGLFGGSREHGAPIAAFFYEDKNEDGEDSAHLLARLHRNRTGVELDPATGKEVDTPLSKAYDIFFNYHPWWMECPRD